MQEASRRIFFSVKEAKNSSTPYLSKLGAANLQMGAKLLFH